MDSIALYIVCFLFIVTLATFFYIVRYYFKREISAIQYEVAKESRKELLPIKLQAIERLTLFLERISPESMILREQANTTHNMNLQKVLLSSIRKEYEHNQAMQIYVSSDTWERVKLAKEEIVRVINLCSSELAPANPSMELAKNILERYPFSGLSHLNRALDSLRSEVDRLSNV